MAHRLTLDAQTCLPEGSSVTKEQIARAGSVHWQEVSSKKVGEVSVSYSETSGASGVSTNLADLKETTYGLQLLSLLRLYGFARYIP